MNIDIDKIKPFPAFTVFCMLASIVPGYAIIYAYSKELFISLDVFRLSALALGITMPLLAVNITGIILFASIFISIIKVSGPPQIEPNLLSDVPDNVFAIYFGTLLTIGVQVALFIEDDITTLRSALARLLFYELYGVVALSFIATFIFFVVRHEKRKKINNNN